MTTSHSEIPWRYHYYVERPNITHTDRPSKWVRFNRPHAPAVVGSTDRNLVELDTETAEITLYEQTRTRAGRLKWSPILTIPAGPHAEDVERDRRLRGLAKVLGLAPRPKPKQLQMF